MMPILGATLISAALYGEDAKSTVTPLAADRPGFSIAPGIVQKGKFQVELGYHKNQGGPVSITDVGDAAVIRYGFIADKLEFRLGLPSRLNAAGVTGFGDSSFGIKYLISPAKGKTIPAFGVILGETFGTGKAAFSSARSQPSLRLMGAWTLSDTQSLTANIIESQLGNGAGGLFKQTAYSALYAQTFGALTPYAEYYIVSPVAAGTADSSYGQFGLAYAYTPYIQFDASYALGMKTADKSKTLSVGVGYKF